MEFKTGSCVINCTFILGQYYAKYNKLQHEINGPDFQDENE